MQSVTNIFMQRADTFLTPLRKSKLDEVSDDQMHSDCVHMISQTFENLAKSGGVFAMTPRQSSDSSTALINHVEQLCSVIPLLQESVTVWALKLKESEQQNRELSRRLQLIPERETLEFQRLSFLELQGQNERMTHEIVSCKLQIQELEELCGKNVRMGACIPIN